MKKNIILLINISILFVFLIGCKKEHEYGFQPNSVRTIEYKNVIHTSAEISGEILASGGRALTERGICWHTSPEPKINNNRNVSMPFSLGTFTTTLNNLQPGTTYYVRAYAINSTGTAYGNILSFKTIPVTTPQGILTDTVSSITQTTAVSGGDISESGGAFITHRGVCWSNTTSTPTINNPRTIDGADTGKFISNISGLLPNTTYYLRAYASNSAGITYGNVITFKTKPVTLPNGIQTDTVSSITQNTAVSGGNINETGGGTITQRGVCWSNTTLSPTVNNSRTQNGSGTGNFISNITGLMPNTTYYVRAYASNSAGTAYGNMVSFKTSPLLPSGVRTNNVSSITQNTAFSGGNVTSDGGATITQKGVCWSSTTTSPTINNSRTIDGSGVGIFSSNITGLLSNTTYFVRAYATNSAGTTYGNMYVFTTNSPTLPSGLQTNNINSITQNTAFSGGNVTSDGGATISQKGVCWSNTTSSPTVNNSRTNDGSGSGNFTSYLSGLLPNTTYYVRAYATNSLGTAYGNMVSFTTSSINVGQSLQGGIVGYIYQPGDLGYLAGKIRGIIVAPTVQSTGLQWGCSSTSINGISNNLGTGANNTTLIVNSCFTSNIAARICDNLSLGGYSDWFLPSYDELYRLYLNRNIIGGFGSNSYWSSSQNSSSRAVGINFSSGSILSTNKSNLLSVRAIRYFSF